MLKHKILNTDYNYKFTSAFRNYFRFLCAFFIFVFFTQNVLGQTVLFSDDFETDKGWTFAGEFERGTPNGSAGEAPDHGNPNPVGAYAGTNAIGTDLDGAYPNNLGNRAYTAVSPVINCSGYSNITLNFQRWLNVEQNSYDHAYIEVSTNGSTWNVVWQNGGTTIQENAWSAQSVDLSTYANNNSTVQVRFALGSTDGGWYYSGWNIDDLEITGVETPPDFGASPGLVYWLRGDLGVTGTNPVTNWADQSGNNNDAAPGNGPAQVTSVDMNNQEVMSFNGTNDALGIADDSRINTGGGYDGAERSMFVAFKTGTSVSGSTEQYIYEQGGGTNGLGVFIKNDNIYVTIYNGGNANRLTNSFPISADTPYILSFIWDNGTLSAKLNNVDFSSPTSNGTIISLNSHGGNISIGHTDGSTRNETGASVGGGLYFQGEIAEIVYYDKALTEVKELEINNDLADRYGINVSIDKDIYYSYQTGNWNAVSTWTHDPGGTTHTATDIPKKGDWVVILNSRTVSLSADMDTTNLDLTIRDGGILNQSTFKFTNGLKALRGTGVHKLSSINYPTVTTNEFVNADGGTTEYNNTANFTLPAAQDTYCNLTINASGVTATQLHNLTLNGDLKIEQGTFRINDNTTTTKLNLTINGNVSVDNGATISVGNGSTNSTTNPNGITGGTAPYLDYYEHFHRIVIYGDFTNNGTVKFTNLTYPIFNAFPPLASGVTSGAASVYFMGASNNTLTCNGTTDFYNLILDKGIDKTYKLTVYATAYANFRLFGANSSGGDTNGATNANPNLKKALWIRTGTFELTGLTIIPSLTEGGGSGTPNSDYYIPENGAMLLNGAEVIVLSTADNYDEINVAYNVSGGSGSVNGVNIGVNSSSFSILGKLQIDNGYFSTRESSGFITWDYASGQFEINGGIVDAKQLRSAGSSGGLASFNQTGGVFYLRGRFQRTPTAYTTVNNLKNFSTSTLNTTRLTSGTNGDLATFNINETANVFGMSGGVITIYDVCGTGAGQNGAFEVFSSAANINVSGGTVEIIPTTGSGTDATQYIIESTAPLGNLIINRASSTASVILNTYDLTIVNDLTITSGDFDANNFDVNIGGDFIIENGTTYTTGNNWTVFNGSGSQSLEVNLGSTLALKKLKIDKPASSTLTLNGTQSVISVQDSLWIVKATLDDNGKTINFTTSTTSTTSYLYNSGIHTGTGSITLADNDPQVITGDGNGIFENIILNNTDASTAPVSLEANTTINGVLTFSQNNLFNINTYELTLTESASVSGANTNRFIQTAGNAGDGSVTKEYSTTASSFTFPIGASSTSHAAAEYTPVSISFNSNPTTYGSITVIPVGKEHPVTIVKNRSLTYYWRVKSTGFSGIVPSSVSHSYTYSNNDLVTSGDVTENEYIAAFYDPDTYSWTKGTTAMVNTVTNTIAATIDNIDGEYTAGDDNPTDPFGTPVVYYSRQTGLWSSTNTWSLTSHTGGVAGSVPGASDVVIIGGADSVYLATANNTANTDIRNCASLQIKKGSALDIGYNPGCNFSVVKSISGGNGNFRVTTNYSSGSTFQLPSGDFSDFNKNLGTTELYSTNSNSGTTYWLPNGTLEYGNLIISPDGGSNIIFPNNDLLIYGNLITRGQNSLSWFCPNWRGSNYPTAPTTPVAKTITVNGDFDLQGGALVWYNRNNTGAQDFIIDGNLIISTNAGIQVYTNGTANTQSISIGGSLINNASAPASSPNTYRGCDFTDIPLTFLGDTKAYITNTSGTPYTILDDVTVNKGSSQSDSLIVDITGTLTTNADNWLSLINGTFKYLHDANLTISTVTEFTIPATAGLYIDASARTVSLANANSNDNDIFLNGKLTIIDGNVVIGNGNDYNNDIEYSGSGFSDIEIHSGSLTVNGQIRRNLSTSSGVLKYTQLGGDVTINGRGQTAANRANAKLEILNAGSEFNMSGGTLTIVRGGGDATYGDLYLRPENSSVTGGEIIFNPNASNSNQNYIFDATVSLYDLTITSPGGDNAYVTLLVSPLTVDGDLTLNNATCTLDANSTFDIPITINGDFDNSGTYTHHNNITTFSGATQLILGSSDIDFYDLDINPVTSLTLNKDATVNNELTLSQGTLICGSNFINAKGNVTNNSTYTDNNAGLILNGKSLQYIGGTGTWGQLELNNNSDAKLINDITFQKDFLLTNGVMDINKYLLTLGANSNIVGENYSATKMITSDGVFSNVGISKVYGVYSGAEHIDTIPLGTSGKYTPAYISYTDIGNVGSIRINNINKHHPAVLDAANVLQYYWEVESSGITGFKGALKLSYLDADVAGTQEADYVAARLLVPGTSWSKAATGSATDNVDETNDIITFNYSNTDNLSGEYTAGVDAAIPDDIPEYTSINNGDWSDKTNWLQTGGNTYACPDGGPNGFIVTIAADDTISTDANYASAYQITINGKLKINNSTYGHNLGTILGNGTLYLESGTMPAGRYTDFFDCSGNATLEYGGTGNYNLTADLYSSVPNLLLSGTGTRTLPAKDLLICNKFEINGPTADNSVNNQKLTIQGTMERYNTGAFLSGSGTGATVSFEGTAAQTIAGTLGDFKGTNAFNNLEINNSLGLSINTNGVLEVKGLLLLTDGLISTSTTDSLKITNTAISCVSPATGSSTSYVDGPLSKMINNGDSFDYPVGKGNVEGNKIELTNTGSGPQLWTVEFFTPNTTANNMSSPLTYVNSDEYWDIKSVVGSDVIVNLDWDANSDLTPLMTANGLSDMRVSNYNTGTSQWDEVTSSVSGSNSSGTVSSTNKVSIPASGNVYYTTACVNVVKPRAQFAPSGAVCGADGIPVNFTYSGAIPLNYTLDYTVDGVSKTQITITAADLPYTLPTPIAGKYKLTAFTYNNGADNGVVDPAEVDVYDDPTPANAGSDQSHCGATSTTLQGNTPGTGTGLWSIESGTGGSFVAPTNPTTVFNGTNGTTYSLIWTISNGNCESADTVVISFPLNPVQPEDFTASKTPVCEGETGVIYTVPNDASVTYTWSYTGANVTINGTTNSVTLDFTANATSGTLGVTATNGCGTSAAREIAITVNPLPIANPTATDATICFGSNSQLDAGISGAYTYSWSPAGSELSNSGIQNPIYTPGTNPTSPTQVTTTFTVTVTDNTTHCADIEQVDVVVNRKPETGNVFTNPN